jgi:hypothetical protein
LLECLASFAISHDATVVVAYEVDGLRDIAGILCAWEASGVAMMRSTMPAGGVSENSAGVTARSFGDNLDVVACENMLAIGEKKQAINLDFLNTMKVHRVRLGPSVLDNESKSLVRAVVVDISRGIKVKISVVNVEQHRIIVVAAERTATHIPIHVRAV